MRRPDSAETKLRCTQSAVVNVAHVAPRLYFVVTPSLREIAVPKTIGVCPDSLHNGAKMTIHTPSGFSSCIPGGEAGGRMIHRIS